MRRTQVLFKYQETEGVIWLDNLKLGYGGTKTEMERLLADAQKLSGVKYDISNLADVYEAIHVIQTEIGITGTTAKEASTTITGSVNMMLAAWSNLATGIADENANIDNLIDNFIESFMIVADNIIPVFETALNGIAEFVSKAADKIVPKLVDVIIKALPKLTEAGTKIVVALCDAITDNIPLIVNAASKIITVLATALGNEVPILKPVSELIKLIAYNLELIVPAALGAVIAYKSYNAIMTTATAIQNAFNLAANANPIGLIVTAIGAAIGVVGGFLNAKRELTEEEKAHTEAIQKNIDSMNALKKTSSEMVEDIEAEAAMTRNLKTELEGIVEDNGKIKEGYEARAAVIVNELNEAFGTEMLIRDGIIQKYQEEMGAIDALMEKKRAEAIMEAERPMYLEASSKYTEALAEQDRIMAEIAEKQRIIDEANANMTAPPTNIHAELEQLRTELSKNQTQLDEYSTQITQYDKNMEAMTEGAYENIKSLNDVTAQEISKADTLDAAGDAVTKAIGVYSQGLESCERTGVEMSGTMKTSIAGNIKDALEKFIELGGAIPDGVKTSIENGKVTITNSTDELLGLIGAQLQTYTDNGVPDSLGYDYTKGYAEGIASGEIDVINAASAIAVTAINATKNTQDSNSPAKETAYLGNDFSDGFAVGIESGSAVVAKASENLVDTALESLKDSVVDAEDSVLGVIDDAGHHYLESEKLYQKRAAQLDEDFAKEQLKARLKNASSTEEIQKLIDEAQLKDLEEKNELYLDALKDFAIREREALEERKEGISDKLGEIKDKYYDAAEEIEDLQKDLADGFKDDLELFTVETRVYSDAEGNEVFRVDEAKLVDIDKQTEQLNAYTDTLNRLNDKTEIPDELFSHIRSLNMEEGRLFTEAILALGEDEFQEYINSWRKYQEIADESAKALTTRESEVLIEGFKNEFGQVPEDFFKLGEDSAEKYGEGFLNEISIVFNQVKEAIASSLSGLLPTGVLAVAGAGGVTTVNNSSVTYNIQPSQGESTQQQLEAVNSYNVLNDILRN